MRTLCAFLIAAFTFIATAGAQRPDLNGTWIAMSGALPATLAVAPSPVFGERFALRLAGAGIVVTRVVGDAAMISTIPIGSGRSATPVPGPLCAGERVLHEAAAWEGDALAITIVATTPAGGGAAIDAGNVSVIRLESADRLVVEGTIVQQGQRRQVGSVYVRTTEALPAARAPLPVAGTPATIGQVAWIGAMWAGTTGALTTEERWTPPASGGMMGVARTLRGAALASFEFLCIAERSGTLVYFAMPNARTPATAFVATAVTPTSVTFENPSHDFPKVIRYARTPDGGLETTISGAGGSRPQTVALRKSGPTP